MAAMQIHAKLSRLLAIFNSHEFCNHHRSITASQSHSSQALPLFNQRRRAGHTPHLIIDLNPTVDLTQPVLQAFKSDCILAQINHRSRQAPPLSLSRA
jgi:hypothetical protein